MMGMLALDAPLRAETSAERILVVVLGAVVLLLSLALVQRLYPGSFFRGFLVAVGIFLSFDIVVFHWIFRLHRITEGSEANVIEPLLVLFGIGLVAYGIRSELADRRGAAREASGWPPQARPDA